MRRRAAIPTLFDSPAYWQRVKALLGSSLAAHFPFWDLTGAVAVDISGNGRNAAYVGTPVLGATGIGDGRTSVNFNAAGEVNAYTAGLAGALDAANFFAGWWAAANDAGIYADSTQYNYCFMGVSATMYYQSRKTNTNTIAFISRRGGTVVTVSVDVPTTTRLYHLAMVGDTANNRIIGYVNGAKQRPGTTLGTWSGTFANTYMQIGDLSPAVGNTPWPGRMAHYTLANVIPTDAVIRNLAQQSGQVIFVGDSRSGLKGWPSAAVELAFPDGLFAYGKRGVANWGAAGYGWADMQAEAATIDALLGIGANILVAWAGVNSALENAAQIYARISSYCTARRAAGWKVIICSEIDSQASMDWHNTIWPALNALLAADHSFADGYADLGAEAELQDATNLTYYNADKTHLTAAGYAVVRDVIYPVIATVA